MKIAFTTPWLRGGGAEGVVCELANTLSEIGHEISILVTKSADCVYSLNTQVQLMDLSGYDHGILSRVRAVHHCILEYSFDVVISFLTGTNIETIMAAYGTKIPVIISERNNPYVDPRSKISRFLRAVTYLHADGYVFQTPDARDFFHKKIRKKALSSVIRSIRSFRMSGMANVNEGSSMSDVSFRRKIRNYLSTPLRNSGKSIRSSLRKFTETVRWNRSFGNTSTPVIWKTQFFFVDFPKLCCPTSGMRPCLSCPPTMKG